MFIATATAAIKVFLALVCVLSGGWFFLFYFKKQWLIKFAIGFFTLASSIYFIYTLRVEFSNVAKLADTKESIPTDLDLPSSPVPSDKTRSELEASDSYEPLKVFTDCDDCPEMVWLPTAERFAMGSPESEPGRTEHEGPQRWVSMDQLFALARHEVTFEDYDRYSKIVGAPIADDRRRGRGWNPVFGVSWSEASDYCDWLGEQTGKGYRLPTEAEWEYAARAGTDTRFHFGNLPDAQRANFTFLEDWTDRSDILQVLALEGENVNVSHMLGPFEFGPFYKSNPSGPVEIGSYPANDWMLYDMHGNVPEWVQDHWHLSYAGAPRDGRAWLEPGDARRQRVYRGGGWDDRADRLRSAARNPGAQGQAIGFRCARD